MDFDWFAANNKSSICCALTMYVINIKEDIKKKN